MPRAFSSDDITKVNSAVTAGTAEVDPGASVAAPTTEGRCGVICVYAVTLLAPPEQWHFGAAAGSTDAAPQGAILLRADLPSNETSWVVGAFGGGATFWAWWAAELANVSFAPVLAAGKVNTVAGPASVTATTTTPESAEDTLVIALLALHHSTAGGATAWPAVSWSNGFVETYVVTRGTGGATNDIELHIALYLTTSPEAGPWSTTATLTGTMTNINASMTMVALRAERYDSDLW